MEYSSTLCDTEIPLRLQNMDAFTSSFTKSLESLRARAQETATNQAKLQEVKGKLGEAEDDLVKALRVKTLKEAKRMDLMDYVASVKARVEDLKRSIQEQQTKNEEYATIVAQQSLVLAASEEKSNGSIDHKDETQEAISWYNRVLGFHVEGGHGIKFIFKNINANNPNEEYVFTIRHENDSYTLLNCEPSLKDMKELIHELNRTNGLFKFVREMRKKFQETVAQEDHQESAFISASAPVSSMSTIKDHSPTRENEHRVEPTEGNIHIKKQNVRRRVKSGVLSPGSASSVRQSPRLKVRK